MGHSYVIVRGGYIYLDVIATDVLKSQAYPLFVSDVNCLYKIACLQSHLKMLINVHLNYVKYVTISPYGCMKELVINMKSL